MWLSDLLIVHNCYIVRLGSNTGSLVPDFIISTNMLYLYSYSFDSTNYHYFYIFLNIFHSKLPTKYLNIIGMISRKDKWYILRQNGFVSKILSYFEENRQMNKIIDEIIPEVKPLLFCFSSLPSKISHNYVNTWPFWIYLQDKFPVSHILNEQYLIWALVISSHCSRWQEISTCHEWDPYPPESVNMPPFHLLNLVVLSQSRIQDEGLEEIWSIDHCFWGKKHQKCMHL